MFPNNNVILVKLFMHLIKDRPLPIILGNTEIGLSNWSISGNQAVQPIILQHEAIQSTRSMEDSFSFFMYSSEGTASEGK